MNNKKVDKKMNKIGKIILISGIILTLVGIILGIVGYAMLGHAITVDLMMENTKPLFSGFTLFALSPVITTVGFVLSVAGGIILLVSYLGAITSFANEKVVPTVQNGVNYVTPTIDKVSQSVTTGFNAAKEEFRKKD